MLRDSRHSCNKNNMMHTTFRTYLSSEKKAGSGLQLGLRFLADADSNKWNVNGKSRNCEADAQSTEPASF